MVVDKNPLFPLFLTERRFWQGSKEISKHPPRKRDYWVLTKLSLIQDLVSWALFGPFSMALPASISELELSMQWVINCLHLLNSNPSSQQPATPLQPLRASVSPSGKIRLTGGALDPSTSGPISLIDRALNPIFWFGPIRHWPLFLFLRLLLLHSLPLSSLVHWPLFHRSPSKMRFTHGE